MGRGFSPETWKKRFSLFRVIIKKQEGNLPSSPFAMNAITLSNFKLHLSLRAKHPHITYLEMRGGLCANYLSNTTNSDYCFVVASFLKGNFVISQLSGHKFVQWNGQFARKKKSKPVFHVISEWLLPWTTDHNQCRSTSQRQSHTPCWHCRPDTRELLTCESRIYVLPWQNAAHEEKYF